MKYIEEYLAERVKIKPLGKLTTVQEDVEPCMPIGERIVIDDFETDIVVWYSDYAIWLERKFQKALERIDELEESNSRLYETCCKNIKGFSDKT